MLAEDDETLQEGLTTGNALQFQVWDSVSKLQGGEKTLENSV